MSGSLSQRYVGSLVILVLACLILYWVRPKNAVQAKSGSENHAFKSFQNTYLIVYIFAMLSDWLQGPYVYELYVSYGFDQQAIAELFVCGFMSSMIVGTFIGSLADKYGRKKMCILYSVCYIIACLTKLVPEYWTLMIGRFLSGISTSLLFSVFESWMICAHGKHGFAQELMGSTFSYATFGNGFVAVIAGLIANAAAAYYGFVAPFMVAIVPLSVVIATVGVSWDENYGDQGTDMLKSLRSGFQLISSDMRIASLGLSQSLFEGAMYTFVFMWTPALKTTDKDDDTSAYLGTIFACFMISVMVGSSLFSYLIDSQVSVYRIPLYLHGTACAAMLFITIFMEIKVIVYWCFLIFECTVGLFYPAYGTIKSERIPEEIRSAVMNIFRIPLNAFVVLLLLKIKYFNSQQVFIVCTITHCMAFASYLYFYLATQKISSGYEYSPLRTKDPIGRASSELDVHMREAMNDVDETV